MNICKEHEQLLQYWTKRLGLQDWNIELIDNCSPREMYNPCNQGENRYNFVHKHAIIRICDKKDRVHDVLPLNYEHLLVHELLHCKFAVIDDSDNFYHDRIVHQLVEDFTKLLLEGRK